MGVISMLSGCFGRPSSKVSAEDVPEAPKSPRDFSEFSAENRVPPRSSIHDSRLAEEKKRNCPLHRALMDAVANPERYRRSPGATPRVNAVCNTPSLVRTNSWYQEREWARQARVRDDFAFIDEQRAIAARAQNNLVVSGQTFITHYIVPPTPLVPF